MKNNFCFTIDMSDEEPGYKLQIVDKDYIQGNHIEINGRSEFVTPSTQWKYARAWYTYVTGQCIIYADSTEDGVRMALHEMASYITDEGRSSHKMVVMFKNLRDDLHYLLAQHFLGETK